VRGVRAAAAAARHLVGIVSASSWRHKMTTIIDCNAAWHLASAVLAAHMLHQNAAWRRARGAGM